MDGTLTLSAPIPFHEGIGRPLSDKHAADAPGPVELVTLSLEQKAAHCRVLDSGQEITLRATWLWDVVPARS